jgi:hypothetical protein
VHRGISETLMTEVIFEGGKAAVARERGGADLGLDPKAANTFDRPDVIVRERSARCRSRWRFPIKLPPLSVTMVQLEFST